MGAHSNGLCGLEIETESEDEDEADIDVEHKDRHTQQLQQSHNQQSRYSTLCTGCLELTTANCSQ